MVFFLAYLGSVVMYMGLFCGVYRALLRRIWGSFVMYMETGLSGAALALDYLLLIICPVHINTALALLS